VFAALDAQNWVLEMAFGEDQCRVRVENAAHNFAILHRLTMDLLKRGTDTKAGLKIRRIKAGANDPCRSRLPGL
jgi:hypothetical protein